MQSTLQRYALSSLTTFVTVGAATLAMMISTQQIQWTAAFWLSLGAVVVRAAFKAVVESLFGMHADPVS